MRSVLGVGAGPTDVRLSSVAVLVIKLKYTVALSSAFPLESPTVISKGNNTRSP